MAKQADDVRRDVSKSYAKAVSSPVASGCCGGGSPQKGVAAKLGGYSLEELRVLPNEVVVNSFGCGNPVALAGISEGDVVLDLGSGAGIDILLASRKVGPQGRVIGVDMTDEMIAKATENIKDSGLTNIEVRKGLIEELPVESESVDWVISNCVINLSPEKDKVFREIARVLRPGGRMMVSDIVAKDLPANVREMADLYSSCISGAISEEEYLAGLREAGLVNLEIVDSLVYDAGQIEAMVASDVEGACGCCSVSAGELRAAASSLAGKVWSIKVSARKPG